MSSGRGGGHRYTLPFSSGNRNINSSYLLFTEGKLFKDCPFSIDKHRRTVENEISITSCLVD